MADLIVKLYELPTGGGTAPPNPAFTVRRAFSAERRLIVRWVAAEFGDGWASECEASFARSPVACFVAVDAAQLVGFSCYDATARGMYGPVGVAPDSRKLGIGRVLLLATLDDMRAHGYAYAVIGGAGAKQLDFYRQAVGAIEIADSSPGFYRGMLRVR